MAIHREDADLHETPEDQISPKELQELMRQNLTLDQLFKLGLQDQLHGIPEGKDEGESKRPQRS